MKNQNVWARKHIAGRGRKKKKNLLRVKGKPGKTADKNKLAKKFSEIKAPWESEKP